VSFVQKPSHDLHVHGTSAWRPHEHDEEPYSGQVSIIYNEGAAVDRRHIAYQDAL
jgi:hypothetical protein